MSKFAFVSNRDLRATLDSDYAEMQRCAKAEAWKAAVVLGGAIIESVLTDHLLAGSSSSTERAAILKMTLGQLIARCRQQGVLSSRTVSLTEAIKEYRNLIHPGREVRLAERADENSALVVQALVDMVAGEVSDQSRARFGLTAEQIMQKLEHDRAVAAILGHLLTELPSHELERLVIDLIPDRILSLAVGDDYDDYLLAGQLDNAYRTALAMVTDEIRKAAAAKFAKVLREATGDIVEQYAQFLFRASDIPYLSAADRAMVQTYMASRIHPDLQRDGFSARFAGLLSHMAPTELERAVDTLLRNVVSGDSDRSAAATEYLDREYWAAKEPNHSAILARIDQWIAKADGRGDSEAVGKLQLTRDTLDLPF